MDDRNLKLSKLYATNEDFRTYVDKCAATYRKTVNETLCLKTTYEYALYLKDTGRMEEEE